MRGRRADEDILAGGYREGPRGMVLHAPRRIVADVVAARPILAYQAPKEAATARRSPAGRCGGGSGTVARAAIHDRPESCRWGQFVPSQPVPHQRGHQRADGLAGSKEDGQGGQIGEWARYGSWYVGAGGESRLSIRIKLV